MKEIHFLILQSVYLPMVLHSQTKLKVQTSLSNYFASIVEKTKVSIDYSHQHFSDCLKDKNQNSFFLSLTKRYEIQKTISSLKSNKSVGPNSIPTKTLKLLKMVFLPSQQIYLISHSLQTFLSLYLTQLRFSLLIKRIQNWNFQIIV